MKLTFLIPPPLDDKPPAERIFGCNYGIYHQPNIFILYQATLCQKNHHQVLIKDCVVEKLNKQELIQFLKKDAAEVYLFYAVYLSRKTDLLARDLIKKVLPQALFIFSGTEPTTHPQDFVDEKSFVIRGETEETLIPLLAAIKTKTSLKKIRGLSYLKEKRVFQNPSRPPVENLDRLPFPNRKLLPQNLNYYNPKLTKTPFTTILTSRGCSYRCSFCVPHSLDFAREIEFKNTFAKKPPVRLRSAGNVIEEFRQIAREGYRAVSIIDDQFLWDKQRIIKICEGIAPFKLEWSCLARANFLTDEELIRSLKKAGCAYIDLGIESFDQKILDDIQKDILVEDFFRAVKLLKKYDIPVELNILIGSSPLETKETIELTVKKTISLDPDYVLFSLCTPFPGTEFYKKAKAQGWMTTADYVPIDPMKETIISYPHLPKELMEKMLRASYLKFYFRPAYLVKRVLKIKSPGDFINKIKTGLKLIRN